MSTFRRLIARASDWLLVTAQTLLGMLRGRSVHILLTGPDVVGMNHLATLLRALSPEHRPAHDTAKSFSRLTITVDVDDVVRGPEILRSIGRFRQLVVVAATADPREMVCREDLRLPHQWVDSADYRFRFGKDGLKSFTEPGVLPRFDGLDEWSGLPGVKIVRVSRENLAENPAEVIRQISGALTGRGMSKLGQRLADASSTAHRLPAQPTFPASDKTTRRLAQQLKLFPALEQRAVSLGYTEVAALVKLPEVAEVRGKVVAFHTPDEVYRAEAARLKATLDALGLEYTFFEVTPEKNWVRTTLLKPSWIIKARDELRGPLLYIDVDAFVHNDPWPYLSQYDGDMAAVVYDNGQLNSATLWINDTLAAREILAQWKQRADSRREGDSGDLEPTGDNGDQGVLKQAVLADETREDSQFLFHRLPVNLAYIFDRTETYIVGPVIIEQLQASRESIGHDKRLARRRERLLQLEAGAPNGT